LFSVQAQRKGLMPAFSFRHIKDLYPVFWSKSKELAELLEKEIHSKDSLGSNVVVIRSWATRATLDIIGLAGMNHDFDSLKDPSNPLTQQYQRMRQAPSSVERIMGLVLSLFTSRSAYIVAGLPTKRRKEAKAASDYIRKVCRDLIKEKQDKLYSSKSDTGVDIISVALRSSVFTNENLADQMMTFLAAGHGTTSHALQWSVYALCKHEDVQSRLRKEIRDNLSPISDRESTITASDIDGLPYLHAFCNEVLRFYPSISTTAREALQDSTVAGTYIPKNTVFTIPMGIVNHDVELWGPSASVFDPERWMGQGRANSGGVQNHIGFLTFLQGPRSCIGSNFSRAELACLVAALVGKFHMQLENPNANMGLNTQGLGNAPLDGVRTRLEVLDGW
jgi:cytochrome P450